MTSDRDEVMLGEFLAAAAGEWREGLAESREAQAETEAAYARLLDSTAPAAKEEKREEESRVMETLGGSIQALADSPVFRAARSESGGGSALGLLRSGLGAIPRLLIGLFGGGEDDEPAPLVKYALPPRMRFEAADRKSVV